MTAPLSNKNIAFLYPGFDWQLALKSISASHQGDMHCYGDRNLYRIIILNHIRGA